MVEPREDDLFRESTMTFGQHLEELRKCLIKSSFGLLIGFLVGLLVGEYVAQFIQRPLTAALKRYYQGESETQLQAENEKFGPEAGASPWTSEQIRERVEDKNLLAEKRYVDSAQLLQELQKVYPELSKAGVPSIEPGKGKLIQLDVFHNVDDDPRLRSKSLGAAEPFSVYVKASLLVGVILASPWIFYQIWHFVAAGLYPHERRYVHTYLPVSLGLFLAGATLAFFTVFQPVLNFLFSFNRSLGIDPEPRINEWLSFVLVLPLGFGIGFQLPLVMLFLERIGVVTVRTYLAQWRIAVLVVFVLSAILTPPDPYSMLLMACPLTLLYFGGVLLCKLLPRHQK
jgi:sec-independent protein translocase protein TatC